MDGTGGYTISGIDPDDQSGLSGRSAGDVNGDGFDDLIIGSQFADQNRERFQDDRVSHNAVACLGPLSSLLLISGQSFNP